MSGERALAEAVLALHKPWYEVNGQRHDHTVYVFGDEVPADHVCRVGQDPCSPEVEEHQAIACVECRWSDEDGSPASPLWPCPTAGLALAALEASA